MTVSECVKNQVAGVLLAVVLLLATAAPGAGQLSAGVDASYNSKVVNGSWGFGGRVGVQLPPLGFANWKLVGGGVWYVPSCRGTTCDWWEAQGMLLFSAPGASLVAPYFGLGTSYHTFDVATVKDNAWGLDALIGTYLGVFGSVLPYAEVRYKFMTGEIAANQFVFTLGFGVGG